MGQFGRLGLIGGVLVASVVAAPASAQECKINDGSPYQLGGAKQYLISAGSRRGNQDEKPKHLANAVRNLTTDVEKMKSNEVGRQFLLARAYSAWIDVGDAEYVMNRGALGIEENPDGSMNLLMAIDSAVNYVIAEKPECRSEVERYRSVHYTRVLNRAVEQLNAGVSDSAIYYARLSQQVNATDPRSWNVMSAAYSNLQQRDSAMMVMGKIIELSGKDTAPALQKVVQQARYNLAVMTIEDASGLEGAEKDAKIKRAQGLLTDYLAISPDDANAKQAQARLAAATGDTAAIANIFADMVNNPANYTAIQLFEAGAAAAGAGQDSSAVTLLQNGLEKNPNHRDALFNLANILMSANRADDMMATAQKLVAIEPNNPTNWQLVAAAWQVKRGTLTDDALRKAASDSIITYITKRDKTNPAVQMTIARTDGKTYELAGSIRSSGTAAVTPTMVVEFLGADGAVLETKEEAFGVMESGSQKEFRFEIANPDVVAYRYSIRG